MKFVKYALIFLGIAIITDCGLALAYDSPDMVNVTRELNKNNPSMTEYFTKNKFLRQSYEHYSSLTRLTDPCPKCKIATKLHREGGDSSSIFITVMGEKIFFNDAFTYYGNYKLEVWRYDFTFLNTFHSGLWLLNIETLN